MPTKGFPLSKFIRDIAEMHLEEAKRHLEIAEDDLRKVIRGEGRSGYYKADTDPVTLLIEAATQVELCVITIKLDDEAHGKDPWKKKDD